MQAILLEKVFYEIPKHMGFFDVSEVGELAMSISPRGKMQTRTKTQDDAFFNANTLVWKIQNNLHKHSTLLIN